jgi:hypothetical protein
MAGPLKTRTKRSIVDNATSGIAPPPRAWSIQTGRLAVAHRRLVCGTHLALLVRLGHVVLAALFRFRV